MFPFVTLPQMFLNHTPPGFTRHLSLFIYFIFISESLYECAAGCWQWENLRAATLVFSLVADHQQGLSHIVYGSRIALNFPFKFSEKLSDGRMTIGPLI